MSSLEDVFLEVAGVVARVKEKYPSLHSVFVFKPNTREEDDEYDWPDMILSTTDDPKVIAAMLGRPEEGDDDD